MSFTVGLTHHVDCGTRSCPCKQISIGVSIFTAAQTNDIRAVRNRLLRSKDCVNKIDSYGYTPLYIASQSNHHVIVKLLLENGAFVDGAHEQNDSSALCGCTPLHRAAYNGALEACQLLISNGASLNALDRSFGDMRTPLMKAASSKKMEIIELLLDAGADANIVDYKGHSYVQILKEEDDFTGKSTQVITDKGDEREMKIEMASKSTATVKSSSAVCSRCSKPSLAFTLTLKGNLLCLKCH